MQTSKVFRSLRFGPASLLILISFAGNSYAQNVAQHYKQTNLVSNVPGMATVTDPNLVKGSKKKPGRKSRRAFPFWGQSRCRRMRITVT